MGNILTGFHNLTPVRARMLKRERRSNYFRIIFKIRMIISLLTEIKKWENNKEDNGIYTDSIKQLQSWHLTLISWPIEMSQVRKPRQSGIVEIKRKQGELNDAREINPVWIYFRDNQVEQFFKFCLFNLKREIISLLLKYYFVWFLHIYFNKKGKPQQNKSLYFLNI